MRRGRAAKGDDSDFDVSASDVGWKNQGNQWHYKSFQGPQKKLTKYLPPGNVMELYHHYVATRLLIGAKVSSSKP